MHRFPQTRRTALNAAAILIALASLNILPGFVASLHASTSEKSKVGFTKLLLGKDVKALLDLPAYKEGLDLYLNPKSDKRLDERGIDLKDLGKYLKEKGVGVERDEWVTVTDVKVDSDRIEVQLGGGGEGKGASKNADKKGAGFKRAGGSRINFRYGRDVTDADLQIESILPLLNRVLDTGKIGASLALNDIDPEFQDAVRAKDIVKGMPYKLVLMSAGEPDQKKVEDSTDDSLHEIWYYMRDGRRWVVRFLNGKVEKVQVF
jgi:hypothetical protein